MGKRRRSRTLSNAGRSLWTLFKTRFFRYVLTCILVVGAAVFATQKAMEALFESSYFKIKTVGIDRSLSFMDKRDLNVLRGKSVFTVDLERLQRNLRAEYPQMAQVKIVKRFPNTILVLAKKRSAFAQASVQNRTVLVDDQGVILSLGPSEDKRLPLISGVSHHKKIIPGVSLGGEDTLVALNIIKEFENNEVFSAYNLTKIDVDNLLSVAFYLSNNLKIIVDKNDIGRKMDMLALVLSQNQLNTEQVKYIDLRFKEPILGTK